MISKVFYTEVPLGRYTVEEASKYNYLTNVVGLHPMFDRRYEAFELKQLRLKIDIVGEAIQNKEIENPKMNTMIFGISSMCNRTVVIVDI